MQVFVTGATGFVGREVTRQLLAAGHKPVCLVRSGSEGKLLTGVSEVRFGGCDSAGDLAGGSGWMRCCPTSGRDNSRVSTAGGYL